MAIRFASNLAVYESMNFSFSCKGKICLTTPGYTDVGNHMRSRNKWNNSWLMDHLKFLVSIMKPVIKRAKQSKGIISGLHNISNLWPDSFFFQVNQAESPPFFTPPRLDGCLVDGIIYPVRGQCYLMPLSQGQIPGMVKVCCLVQEQMEVPVGVEVRERFNVLRVGWPMNILLQDTW